MYVLSWRTVSALTRVLFWYLFPELRNTKITLSWALNRSSLEYIHYSLYIDGLVQDCSNPVVNALELLQSFTKASIYNNTVNIL